MVCSCFTVYVLANNTWFVPFFESRMVALSILFSFLYIVDLNDRKCVFLHAFCHIFAK